MQELWKFVSGAMCYLMFFSFFLAVTAAGFLAAPYLVRLTALDWLIVCSVLSVMSLFIGTWAHEKAKQHSHTE